MHGLPAVDYTADQLLYLPRNKRIHKLYGYSPVEQVVMTVNVALRRAMAQLSYFTEGNIPEALVSCPPDWRPSQIREMQEIFDDMLRGNLSERSGAKFVPGGLNVQFTKDALRQDKFDEWLVRIVCYAFSVPPTAFVKQTNRATADSAQDTGLQEGLAPLQNWVKALIDRVLAEDFAAPDLEFQWNEDRALSASEAMSVNTGYVAAGLKTRNEVRADIGLPPLPGGDTALVTTATGLVPITAEVAKRAVGKDWHFDPGQPRDGQGRWTADGGSDGAASADDLEVHPQSGDAEAQTIFIGDNDVTSLITHGEDSTVTTSFMDAADQVENKDATVRANIMKNAMKNVGSEDWTEDSARGAYDPGTNKCNQFVFEMLADSGADPGMPNHGHFGILYPPVAQQWANPDYIIPGWYVLGPHDVPAPGDVVAQTIQYSDNATGHVMIVGPSGTVIGTGPNGVIEMILMPDKLGPRPSGPMVFRRWRSKG